MKKILVPCDLSQQSINAFQFALDIAERSTGTVFLLNVVELPVLNDTLLMPALNFEDERLKDSRDKIQNGFKRTIEKYKREGVQVISNVTFGLVYAKIVDFINEHHIDLVVMGSQGANGLRELMMGSNAEKVVRTSPVPVLVIKDYYKGPIKNIIFPIDLEPEHREMLVDRVKELQTFFGARLHILWINTPLNFTADTVTFKKMEEFVRQHKLKNYTINVFNHPDEEKGILAFAERTSGDLIAMGTHSRKGISHLINGSLTEDIVNHCKGLIWTYSLKNELVDADA
ncbi:MAG: universal stress protein [Chryseolinea sp.]